MMQLVCLRLFLAYYLISIVKCRWNGPAYTVPCDAKISDRTLTNHTSQLHTGNTYYEHHLPNLVMITSILFTSNARLSYNPIRSIYSPLERLYQTLESIKSVRRHIPNARIFVIECSPPENMTAIFDSSIFGKHSFEHMLRSRADFYRNYYDVEHVRAAVESPHKSVGETNLMLEFINKDLPREIHHDFNMFFKLSGRYFLNENFNYTKFDHAPGDSVVHRSVDKDSVSTRLFMIRYNYFAIFTSGLKKMLFDEDFQHGKSAIEGHIAKFALPPKNTCFDVMGVSGNVSVDGSHIVE